MYKDGVSSSSIINHWFSLPKCFSPMVNSRIFISPSSRVITFSPLLQKLVLTLNCRLHLKWENPRMSTSPPAAYIRPVILAPAIHSRTVFWMSLGCSLTCTIVSCAFARATSFINSESFISDTATSLLIARCLLGEILYSPGEALSSCEQACTLVQLSIFEEGIPTSPIGLL
jgi:hypothetical protein